MKEQLFKLGDKGVFFNGESKELIKEMIKKGEKINGIITSPPYNTSNRVGAKDVYNKRYDIHKDNLDNTDYVQWTIENFKEFEKILEKNGAIIYNLSYGTENIASSNLVYETVHQIYNNTDFCVADTLFWKKSSAIPNNVSHNKLTRIVEMIFVFVRKEEYKSFKSNKQVKSVSSKGQKFYENIFNFIEAKNNDGANKLNKATFSTELVEKILNIYFQKGDTILDPFGGTGTTANACAINGFNFIQSEISKEQHTYSIERVKNNLKKSSKKDL